MLQKKMVENCWGSVYWILTHNCNWISYGTGTFVQFNLVSRRCRKNYWPQGARRCRRNYWPQGDRPHRSATKGIHLRPF